MMRKRAKRQWRERHASAYEDTRAGVHEDWMELAPGFRRLMAERLTPERPTTVAVTRHLE